MNQANNIRHILRTCRTVAVAGLSPRPYRASNEVARYMQVQGWRIIPINPNATEILGQKALSRSAGSGPTRAYRIGQCGSQQC